MKLDENQRNVLERGLSFAPTPRHIPTTELITGTERALRFHSDANVAESTRAAIANIIRKAKPPKSNITKQERPALRDLHENEDIVISKTD